MSSLDNLPGDQRAVLQMVLNRGRSYEEIARLLSINPAAVRERAQIALDTIGPHTAVAPEHQHRIADYLLGQLSGSEAEQVRELLADSPGDRAWARVVSSELAPLTGDTPLPEIPVERPAPREPDAPRDPTRRLRPRRGSSRSSHRPPRPPSRVWVRRRPRRSPSAAGACAVANAMLKTLCPPRPLSPPPRPRGRGAARGSAERCCSASASWRWRRCSSSCSAAGTPRNTSVHPDHRLGAGRERHHHRDGGDAHHHHSGTAAKVVAQINLSPPSGAKPSKSAGIAEVLNEGTTDGIAIVAQNVPPNTTKPPNAYAVWLYNSQKDAKILGFVNPGVTRTGRLSTAGALPANASHYKQLIVTVETTASPKEPGSIILQGTLTNL